MANHVKIGSAILDREYFWSVDCGKCKEPPVVHFRADAESPKQRLEPKPGNGTGSHVFERLSPGLYCLKNFCGGGFRFDAKVSVTAHTVDILHLRGTAEA